MELDPFEIITPRSLSVFKVEIPINLDRLLFGPATEVEIIFDTRKYVGDVIILWGLIQYPRTIRETQYLRFQGSQRFCQSMIEQISTELLSQGGDNPRVEWADDGG